MQDKTFLTQQRELGCHYFKYIMNIMLEQNINLHYETNYVALANIHYVTLWHKRSVINLVLIYYS